MTYKEKLLDPRWQKRRLEILNRDGFACTYCCNDKDTLHVHHTYYEKGVEPWDAKDEYITTLCERCHKSFHEILPYLQSKISDLVKSRLKDPFITRCLYDLFTNTEKLDELIYLLWENKGEEKYLLECLRDFTFPTTYNLSNQEEEK